MVNCKTCNAEIIWIKTKKGKHHPVDAKPKKMWVQDPMSVDFHGMILQDCYESHFATCPDADMHRTKKDNLDNVNKKLQIQAEEDMEERVS